MPSSPIRETICSASEQQDNDAMKEMCVEADAQFLKNVKSQDEQCKTQARNSCYRKLHMVSLNRLI